MKKKNFINGLSARLAFAIVALTGVLLTGCYKDDGLDVNGGIGEIVLPPATYTINGTIFDAGTGAAITDATVTVQPNTAFAMNGNSFTSEVAPGNVTITVTAENYETVTRVVTIDKINAGQAAVYPQIFPMLSSTVEPDPSFSQEVVITTEETSNKTDVNQSNTGDKPISTTIKYNIESGSSFNKTVADAVSEAGFTNEMAEEAESMILNYLAKNGYYNSGIVDTPTEKTISIPAQTVFVSYDVVYTYKIATMTFSVYGKKVNLVVKEALKTTITTELLPIDHGHGHGDGLAGGGVGGAE